MSDLVRTGSKYTDEDRRRTVVEYCVLGNTKQVAKITGIPRTTINDWKKTDWWDEESVKVRHEINEHILAQNLQIATKAGERVLDSLANGDEKLVWDKTECKYVIKHVKPSGKEAAVIGGIYQDKARVQQSLPTGITSKSTDMVALANEFRKLSLQWDDKQIISIPGESEEVD